MKKPSNLLFSVALIMMPIMAFAGKDDSMKAINQAKVLIESAERNNANKHAPYLIKSARDSLANALRQQESRDWVDAEISAKMSQRDAEVADAKSQSMRAEKSYNDLKAAVDLLKTELARKRSIQ